MDTSTEQTTEIQAKPAETWEQRSIRLQAEDAVRIAEAKKHRVYLAMGPIIGGVLIANLITAVIVAIISAISRL